MANRLLSVGRDGRVVVKLLKSCSTTRVIIETHLRGIQYVLNKRKWLVRIVPDDALQLLKSI